MKILLFPHMVSSFFSSVVTSSAHNGNNHPASVNAQNSNSPHGAHKKGNRKDKESQAEQIRSLRDGRTTLIDASRILGVSRSTMKRRNKEFGFASSRKKSNCTNTKSPSGGEHLQPNLVECTNSENAHECLDSNQHNLCDQVAHECSFIDKSTANATNKSVGELIVAIHSQAPECMVETHIRSQPNLVECTNPDGPVYAQECLDVNQHNLSDQALVCDFISNSTANATEECVGELNVANHRHTEVHESVPECTVGTGVHPLLGNVQDSSSSSSFDIKATYKEDIVRFKWSSTADLEELKKAVVESLMIEFDSFKLKYQDEEEDWVLINTNEHLKRALTSIRNNILRLKVTDL